MTDSPRSDKEERRQEKMLETPPTKRILDIPKEKIEIALEINPNAGLFMDENGTIKAINNFALRLFGYVKEEVVGLSVESLVPERYREKLRLRREAFFASPNTQKVGPSRDLMGLKKDGTEFPLEVGLSPCRTEDGPAMIATIVDISTCKELEEMIRRQQEDLMELSTPVIQLWSGILVLPVVGTLDSERSRVMMEQLLNELSTTGSGVAIVDISGVPTVDTLVAQHLMKTIDAAKLMGCECIISGIRPEIANTIVNLGIDLARVKTKSTMSRALADAFDVMGLKVVKKEHRGEERFYREGPRKREREY